MLQVTSHREVVLVGRRPTSDTGGDHRGRDPASSSASRLLAWFGVFSSGKVSTPTRFDTDEAATAAVSTSAPTVTDQRPRARARSPAQVPSATLAPGDRGSQVEILQRALAALGFLAGKPDGDYGPATQSAVERFQASEGLPQVGVVGPQTLAALQHALSRRPR